MIRSREQDSETKTHPDTPAINFFSANRLAFTLPDTRSPTPCILIPPHDGGARSMLPRHRIPAYNLDMRTEKLPNIGLPFDTKQENGLSGKTEITAQHFRTGRFRYLPFVSPR